MNKKNKYSGFTLIELMMVMAIIAVLSMLALPMYTNYVGRAQVSEAIQMAASIKPEVEGAFAANGSLPISVSLPQGSSNAASVACITHSTRQTRAWLAPHTLPSCGGFLIRV